MPDRTSLVPAYGVNSGEKARGFMYKRENRWYSDFWYDGERYVKSHGPVSKTVAKEKDRSLRAEVAAGTYMKAKNNPVFSKALDEHLKRSKAENQGSTYRRNQLSAKPVSYTHLTLPTILLV